MRESPGGAELSFSWCMFSETGCRVFIFTHTGVQFIFTHTGVQFIFTHTGVQFIFTHTGVQFIFTHTGVQFIFTHTGVQFSFRAQELCESEIVEVDVLGSAPRP